MQEEQKLEDFGAHIRGAKKETYAFTAIDLTDTETAKQPLSKLWPAKSIEAIENKTIAAIAHTLRGELPAKPRQAANLSRWLTRLHAAQTTVSDLLANPAHAEEQIEKTSANYKAYLLTQIDRADWKHIGEVRLGRTVFSDPALSLHIEIGKQSQSYPAASPSGGTAALFAPHLDNIRTRIAQHKQADKSAEPALTAQSFDVYERRSNGSAYICAKTDRKHTKLAEFPSTKEAFAHLKDPAGLADLNARWQEHRAMNAIAKSDMRSAENRPRTGENRRTGDITPEQFMQTFNIRGGQFGNWVKGDQRQEMLNAAYDGLMDLSRTLEIPPQAIGLDGTLGIAFGARGSGRASAHYEPAEKVINLTKTRGAGSLAHEWWHALDHYLHGGEKLLTDSLHQRPIQARHPELLTPVKALVQEIRQTDLYQRSMKADDYREKPYFATDAEMSARAFEGVVKHRLAAQGIENDFLVNIKSEEAWAKNPDAYPYPTAAELEQISKAYTAVFDSLKTADKVFIPARHEAESNIHADTLAAVPQENTTTAQAVKEQAVPVTNESNTELPPEKAEAQTLRAIKFDWAEISSDDQEPQKPWQTLKEAENWYIDTFPVHQIEESSGYFKTQLSLITVDALGQEQQHTVRIDVGAAQGDYNPHEQRLEQYLEQYLQAHQIVQADVHTKQTSEHIAPAQQAPNTDQKFWQTFYQRYDEAQMLDNIMAEKPVYLAVPYADNLEAKTLGAKWDKDNGSWYAPAGMDTAPLRHYLPKQAEVTGGKHINDFIDSARAIGIQMDRFDSASRSWQRLPIDGKHYRHKDGAVRLYDNADGTIGGIARNLSTGAEITWSNRGAEKQSLGKEHKTALKLNSEIRQTAMQEMRDTVAHLRGADAVMLYRQLPPARGDEPYLQNKSMQHHITLKRLDDGTVVMPILDAYRDNEGQVRMQIRSLQTISPEGEKKLMAQGEKSGGFFALPNTPTAYQNPERIIIAEGLATAENALQIAQAQQEKSTLAIVAVDAGNLAKAADKIAELYPHAEKIIAADNDRATELKIGKNPGLAAAQQVQAKHPEMQIVLPPAIDGKSTDWNDYLQQAGLENAVRHFRADTPQQTISPKTPAPQHKPLELNIDGLCAREIGKAAYKAINGDIQKLPELTKALTEKGYKLDENALRAAAGHPITLQDAFTKAVSRAPVSKAPMKVVSNISEPAKPKLITEINR